MMTDEVRATMAANLVDFLLELEAKAKLDSDPVSIEGFADDDGVVGMVVLIRGHDVCERFMQWAAEHGYHTPGKGIVDGTHTTVPS